MFSPILTPEDTARLLQVKVETIYSWLRAGKIPGRQIGGSGGVWRISLKALEDFCAGDDVQFRDFSTTQGPLTNESADDTWAGHWFFNTNETYAPGAYERMFEKGVIAIYGYDNKGENLEGSERGQIVFAYVNEQGLRALGEVIDPAVRQAQGIFFEKDGNPSPEEYHVAVNWKIILPKEKAISASEASRLGYSLPVRGVFGRLHRGSLAKRLEEELRNRA